MALALYMCCKKTFFVCYLETTYKVPKNNILGMIGTMPIAPGTLARPLCYGTVRYSYEYLYRERRIRSSPRSVRYEYRYAILVQYFYSTRTVRVLVRTCFPSRMMRPSYEYEYSYCTVLLASLPPFPSRLVLILASLNSWCMRGERGRSYMIAEG